MLIVRMSYVHLCLSYLTFSRYELKLCILMLVIHHLQSVILNLNLSGKEERTL